MKKSLLIACAVTGLLMQSVLAQISLTAQPASQTVAQGGNFDVTIHLAVTGTTPADADGFNLWLETAAANSGLFTVTSVTPIVNWSTPAGGTVSNDVITTTGSTHSGFAQNSTSLGFVDSTPMSTNKITTPITDQSLETIHLSASNSVVIGQTYTFAITNATTSSPRTSGINDSGGNFFPANTTGSFQITIAAVPEPATWSLLGLGGLGSLGLNFLRRRRS